MATIENETGVPGARRDDPDHDPARDDMLRDAALRDEERTVSPRDAAGHDEAHAVRADEPGPGAALAADRDHDHDHPEGPTRLASLSRLKGMDVRDADGEKVGTIRDVFLDPRAEHVRYLSVSTGWLSRGTHVVPIDDVTYIDEGDGRDAHAVVPYSTEHLKGAPSLDEDGEVTPESEREIRGYYDGVGRRDAERDVLRARQRTPAPTPQIAEAEMADAIRRDTTDTETRGR